ncbi:hypothetical protein V7101_20485, partial [Bacillus velezensis]|uniref:TcaA 3rd/4th domain-containing protein n=1 Tax=Bacillus velezensis TaxID=492670 RepID=UPI002FFE1BF9
LIAILITHFIVKSLFTPERMVKSFEKAVTEHNFKKVTRILEQGGTQATLDEESVKSFMEYMNSSGLIEEVDEIVNTDTIINHQLIDKHDNHVLTIKKGNKFLGLYQTYTISAEPFELKVISPIDELELKLNNDISHLNKNEYEKSYKKILPGKYTLSATYKGEYSDVEETVDLDFSTASHNKLENELTFDVSYVQIYSNEPEATLFVNGKDTGKKINELEKFGPFLLNGQTIVHAEVEKNGQLVKTEEVPINGKYIDLIFELSTQSTETTDEENGGFFAGLQGFLDKYLPNSEPSTDLEEKQLIDGLFNQNGQAFLDSKEYQNKIKKKNTTQKLISFAMKDSKQDDSGMLITTNETYELT